MAKVGANLVDSPEGSKCTVGIYNSSNNACVVNLCAEDRHDAVPDDTAETFGAKAAFPPSPESQSWRFVSLEIEGAPLTPGGIHVFWEILPP